MATRYKIITDNQDQVITNKIITLKAGTSVSGTAPLKLTSGPLNTTAEVGAVEFLTDAYYGTITTGAARKQFAFTSDIVSQVEDSIIDGHTTIAPSGNAVFDALALKADLTTPTTSLFRQALINGNFDVWQRGTSAAISSAIYSADRWYGYRGNFATGATIYSVATTDLDGSNYNARIQRNNTNTDDTNVVNFVQSLESQESIKFRGKKLTLSFYARKGANFSSTSSILTCCILTGKGTDQKDYAFTSQAVAVQENKTLTTSWQKFMITSTNVIASNITQLAVYFSFIPVGTAGGSDYFDLAQVQLNEGSVALPFMPKSFAQELLDCQRYCYAITSNDYDALGQGAARSTTIADINIPLFTEMRIIPTLTATGSNYILSDTVGSSNVTNIELSDLGWNSTKNITLKVTVASGLTQYRPYFLLNDETSGRVLILSAEL